MNRNTLCFIGAWAVFVFMTFQMEAPFQIFGFVLDFQYAELIVAAIYTLIFFFSVSGLHDNAVSEATSSPFSYQEHEDSHAHDFRYADYYELHFHLEDIRENIKNVNTDDELDQMEKDIEQMESVMKNHVK